MQNTNKMLSLAKQLAKQPKKLIYIFIIWVLLFMIFQKIHTIQTPDIVEKTQMQILVEKQQNNLEIIWVKLEAQQDLRNQINALQVKLDANIQEVTEIEWINADIRDEMLKIANTLSLTWATHETR